jgi:D-sedoheptulose 7-phosphate isomerase
MIDTAMKNTTRLELLNLIERYPVLARLEETITQAFNLMLRCYRTGGKILLCGNGGSAADANHIVGELMKGFRKARKLNEADGLPFQKFPGVSEHLQKAIPAISLCVHSELISAYSNDVDPSMIYAQQVYAYMKDEDILVGLSTSGNSRNVVNAFQVAHALSRKSIAFTGASQGQIWDYSTVVISVPEIETYKVQELHLPIYHCICAMLEEEVFE